MPPASPTRPPAPAPARRAAAAPSPPRSPTRPRPPPPAHPLATPGVHAHQVSLTPVPLGRGSFGSVWRGSFSGCPVAVKICHVASDPHSPESRSAAVQFRRETARYQQLRHPCIVQFFCVVAHPQTNQLMLVTELMRGGSLFDAIARLRRAGVPHLQREGLLRIALHITNGLSYLHASHFSFGDLKTMNVLLSEPPDIRAATFAVSTQAKLCDFGLSRNLKHLVTNDPARSPRPSETQIPARNGPAGTFAYLAPEAFSGLPTDDADAPRRADVFALAIVLWELATLQRPWPGRHHLQLIRLVRKEGRRPEWPTDCSHLPPGYVELVERCWHSDPLQRPCVDDVGRALSDMYAALPSDELGHQSPTHQLYPPKGPRFGSTLPESPVDPVVMSFADDLDVSLLAGIDVVYIDDEEEQGLDGLSADGTVEHRLHGRTSSSVRSLHPADMSAVTGESASQSPESTDITPHTSHVKGVDTAVKGKSYAVPLDVDIEEELVSLHTADTSPIAGELEDSAEYSTGSAHSDHGAQSHDPGALGQMRSYDVPDVVDGFEEMEEELFTNNMHDLGMGSQSRQMRTPAAAVNCRATRQPGKPPLARGHGLRTYTIPSEIESRGTTSVDQELQMMEQEETIDIRSAGVNMYSREHFR